MHQKSKDLQLQYEGFIQTPFLWHGKGVFDLMQFESNTSNTSSFSATIEKKLRLGKLVERFVSFELEQKDSIKILAENIQIQREKITRGELDCLLTQNNTLIHLEIIYKFYLYDSSQGSSDIYHWIGPNRNDSLYQKLTKLKDKQLPLLYSEECKKYLAQLSLPINQIKQQIYFKAQLFVPIKDIKKEYLLINNQCINGFYCSTKELFQFSDCKFFIPKKHDWLIIPHTNVDWHTHSSFLQELTIFMSEQNSPLCWLKKSNGELIKFFVVWW